MIVFAYPAKTQDLHDLIDMLPSTVVNPPSLRWVLPKLGSLLNVNLWVTLKKLKFCNHILSRRVPAYHRLQMNKGYPGLV